MVPFEKMYFCSDLHINHYWINQAGEPRGVILFERTQFKTIQEHDQFVHNALISWAQKHPDCGLWILGDFGDTDYLYWIDEMRAYGCEVYFLYGNHDSASDFDKFKEHFNEVYRYPTYITSRVLLSHEPQYPMPVGELNIMGAGRTRIRRSIIARISLGVRSLITNDYPVFLWTECLPVGKE